MNFATYPLIDDNQWTQYKQLELISNAMPNPAGRRNPLKSSLNVVWRSLLGLLIDELVEEQRVEYLDRCWEMNEFGEGKQASSSLKRLWVLMD